MHFIGALSLKEMNVFTQECETVDAESVVAFFTFLEASSNVTIINVICDNGRSNKNKKVEGYPKTSSIKIHYLPPYSPNSNSIERLWNVLREKKTLISSMKNLSILKQKYVSSFWRRYQKSKMN